MNYEVYRDKKAYIYTVWLVFVEYADAEMMNVSFLQGYSIIQV